MLKYVLLYFYVRIYDDPNIVLDLRGRFRCNQKREIVVEISFYGKQSGVK